MGLPCRHIFVAREHLDIPLADNELCLVRWTQEYYLKNQRVSANCEENANQINPNVNISDKEKKKEKRKPLSQGQKLKIGKTELMEINSLISELSTNKFYQFINFFEEVKRRILMNEPVELVNNIILPEDNEIDQENEASIPENDEIGQENEASLPEDDKID
ncbi:uncharacterized protein LOC127285726 [Leptopilina boulardi]|uniref:uncharacterized protein LOC127285726 n=1 Tax=Leptopilina boulardi TaxID=63433 RepID=UPI0021F67CE7|nr:uncharacterized protein LOC127285726 [Leptopilina boulardi]